MVTQKRTALAQSSVAVPDFAGIFYTNRPRRIETLTNRLKHTFLLHFLLHRAPARSYGFTLWLIVTPCWIGISLTVEVKLLPRPSSKATASHRFLLQAHPSVASQ